MKENIIAVGFDPGDFTDGNEVGALVVFDEDSVGIGAMFLHGVQNFIEAGGQRAGGTGMVFADATKDLSEAIFGEGLQQVVEGMDFEGAKSVVVVSSNENDGRHVVRADRFDYGEAVTGRHLYVEENEVRLEFFDRGNRGFATARFAEDLNVRFLAEKANDFAASGRFIIDNENF